MAGNSLNTSRVNLKLFQTFALIAENSSFREAADQIGRSQSAVSTQVKHLEEQIGVALFHRTTRNVKLTAEGQQLLDNVKRAMSEIDSGLRHLREVADLRRGRVALACAPTFAATRLPAILAAFEREYPHVRVVLQELKSAELFKSIRDGAVDFGVGPVVGDGEFEFEPLLAERVFALVPSHMTKAGDRITLQDLSKLPIIQFHTNTILAQLVAEAAEKQKLELKVRYQCIQAQTLVALAEAGLGATILTETVAQSVRSSKVQKMLLVRPELTQHFGIIHARGQMLAPAASRLANLIRDHLKAGGAAEAAPRRRPPKPRTK